MHIVESNIKVYYKDALLMEKRILKAFATDEEAINYVNKTEHVGEATDNVYYFCSCVVYGDEIDLTKCLEL